MERMSLEEKKKWVEDHLGEYYAHTWRDIFERQVELAKAGFVDDIVTSKIDIDCTFLEVEIGVNQFYYGEPYSEQILCNQEWLECDLSDLHAEIKDKDYETAIYCILKDKKIIKKYYSYGNANHVVAYNFDEVLKAAKELNAEAIYFVHNHPFRLVVEPSKADANTAKLDEEDAMKAGLKYNWGVVTPTDYWDYEQLNKPSIEKICERTKKIYRQEGDLIEGKEKMSIVDILKKIKEVAERQ